MDKDFVASSLSLVSSFVMSNLTNFTKMKKMLILHIWTGYIKKKNVLIQ